MRYKKSSLALGFPTIINILLLLFFGCTAMLSLNFAKVENASANHSMDITKIYYNADKEAQSLLSSFELVKNMMPDDAGIELETILNEKGISAIYNTDNQTLSYEVPADILGTLEVNIKLTEIGHFEITKWQLAYDDE